MQVQNCSSHLRPLEGGDGGLLDPILGDEGLVGGLLGGDGGLLDPILGDEGILSSQAAGGLLG